MHTCFSHEIDLLGGGRRYYRAIGFIVLVDGVRELRRKATVR